MNSYLVMFGVLVLAVCLTQFASDIYSPSLPAIADSLYTTNDMVQWSMSAYMFATAISQLIYGPISEGLGRKKPLVFGLVVMLVGTAICLLANTIEILIIGRFVQGLGAGSCAALWRPIFRDTFSGDELAKYSSYLVVFIMFIIPGAPVLGGYLQSYFNWKASFVFMTGYCIIAILGILFLFRETNNNHHISNLHLVKVKHNYIALIKSPMFMAITFGVLLSYGALFSWFVVGPILIIDHLKFSPEEFGWITFLSAIVAYSLSGYVNGKYVKTFGMSNMLRFGWAMMLLSGIAMLAGWLIIGLNIWGITVPMFLFYFGSTFIWPNAFAASFTPFGHIAGYAGALYGFMQISGAAIVSGLLAYLPDHNQSIFAIVIIVTASLAWLTYEIVTRANDSHDNLESKVIKTVN